MTDWKKDVKKDSPLLYHFDIEGGTPLKVTIEGFGEVEAFCPQKKKKGDLWCLKFKGAKKMLGMNMTNGYLIQGLYGANRDNWIGKEIWLRIAEAKGDKCIRVHAPGAVLPAQCRNFKYIDDEPAG